MPKRPVPSCGRSPRQIRAHLNMEDEKKEKDINQGKDTFQLRGDVNDEKGLPQPDISGGTSAGIVASQTHVEPNNRTSLESLTVAAIKGKLREAGLPLSGRKAVLIERLLSNSTASKSLP